MKKIALIILTALSLNQAIAQTNNPVFNSVSINEKSLNDHLLISNYYTLKNNLENKSSSVFISPNPTLEQIEKAAINLPSDFFLLTKNSKMVAMVMLQNSPKREFMVIKMATKQQSTFPCTLTGDVTENRAKEIVKEKYDSTAVIESSKLKFNQKEFKLITTQEIEDAVLSLIKTEKLDRLKPSDAILYSKKEITAYVLTESKKDGKLDFFTEIKGKEFQGVQVKPGIFTTLQSISIYKWARACFDIGVNTVEDVYEIYVAVKQKDLNPNEKAYLKAGFNREWE